MAVATRIRSKNYTELEKTLLKQIVSNQPIIESKNHTAATEQKKKSGWAAICSEFNANENVTKRTVQQLQVRYLHSYLHEIISISTSYIHIFVTSLILNVICLYRLSGRTSNWL